MTFHVGFQACFSVLEQFAVSSEHCTVKELCECLSLRNGFEEPPRCTINTIRLVLSFRPSTNDIDVVGFGVVLWFLLYTTSLKSDSRNVERIIGSSTRKEIIFETNFEGLLDETKSLVLKNTRQSRLHSDLKTSTFSCTRSWSANRSKGKDLHTMDACAFAHFESNGFGMIIL